MNGVAFQSFAAPSGNGTAGNFTLVSTFTFTDNSASASASAPFSGLSVNYQLLLSSRVAGISPFSLAISGLVLGAQYEFQFWSNNSSGNFGYGIAANTGATSSGFLSGNTQGSPGGLGQFAIGSFTADSAFQMINFDIDEVGYLNAFQLRRLTANAVPDLGGTLPLLALALAGLLVTRKKSNSNHPV